MASKISIVLRNLPNNDASILMLKKRGYDVLNLIEIRRKLSDEKLTTSIKVGNHDFKY